MGQQEPVPETIRFGKYLRDVREERRLSLDQVEEMSLTLSERVTKSHLSRIENGQATPSFPRLFTLSQIYGIPVSFIAERFELCLRAGTFPVEATVQPLDALLEEARKLRRQGRHGEALVLYEAMLERQVEIADDEQGAWESEIRLHCINCLIKLSRDATAKEQCERLLGHSGLTPRQQVVTLQYFAMCCYKMGKYTVALMALDRAEQELGALDDPDRLTPMLGVLTGNVHFSMRHFNRAADAFRSALELFRTAGDPFEACRTQLNLAAALIEIGRHDEARGLLKQALEEAERAGYDRQSAFALSHLAMLAFREDDMDGAEAHCLRSNRLARPREYVTILFRNCFYLWRIARNRRDEAGIKANERTLRTYLNRIEDYVPEAEEFKASLGRGMS